MNKLSIVSVISLITPFLLMSAKAEDDGFKNSNVLSDLNSDSSFNVEDYPVIEGSSNLSIINFAEMGYSDISKELYSGFIYFYNPGLISFDLSNSKNSIGLQTVGNSIYNVIDIPLDFVSVSNDFRFLKYQLNDDLFSKQYFSQSELNVNNKYRSYSFTYLNLYNKSLNKLVAYNVAKEFRYSGYGVGMNNNVDSSLSLSMKAVETINVDSLHDVYRFNSYSDKGKGHQNDLFYCTFQVPKSYSTKGDLVSIDTHYFQARTNDLFVFDNVLTYTEYLDILNLKDGTPRPEIYIRDYNNYNFVNRRVVNYKNINIEDYFNNLCFYSGINKIDKETLLDRINNTGREESYIFDNKNYLNHIHESSFLNKDKLDILSYDDVYSGNGWQYFKDGLLFTDQSESIKDLAVLEPINKPSLISDLDTLKITKESQALLDSTLMNPLMNTYILRYLVDDYHVSELWSRAGANEGYKIGYSATETVVLDFQIVTLTFNKDGVITKIGAVDQPKDNLGNLTPPLETVDLWKWILGILAIVIAFILVLVFFPSVLTLFVQLIIWLIGLPIRLVRSIIKVFKN